MPSDDSLSSVLEGDEVREVLRETFYSARVERPSPPRGRRGAKGPKKAKPDHYRVICISIYEEDLARLDQKVAELKAEGHRKMNRSALIRFALDSVDTGTLPKGY